MIETSSDRDWACFCCSTIANDLNSNCDNCGSPINIGPQLVGSTVSDLELIEYKSRGFYGLTFKAQNSVGIHFAIKLIPRKLYSKQKKNFMEEIAKYRELGDHPNIAKLTNAGDASISVNGHNVEIHFITMEWIEGITLREFCEKSEVVFSDAYSICNEISSALTRFEKCNLVHNDLNADNIMIRQLEADEIGTKAGRTRTEVKLIDTGSAVFKEKRKVSKITDLEFLGQHATSLVSAVQRNNTKPLLDERDFLDSLSNLAGQLRDENEARRISEAQNFYNRLQVAFDSRADIQIDENERLNSPFAYINALDFKDNSTLVGRLFIDEFPWIRESIMGAAKTVLITGPRGCGKTMILKNMRLRTQLLSSGTPPSPETFDTVLQNVDFIGFFVSARVALGNHLLTSKLPAWAEDESRIICKFLLLYTIEILDTLSLIKSYFKVDFDVRAEQALFRRLDSAIGSSSNSFTEALNNVRQAVHDIRTLNFDANEASELTNAAFLQNICALITKLHPSFRDKSFNFLLDDFSKPKIPPSIQKCLLPIIWASGEGYFFKVSAHSRSVEDVDSRGVKYDEQRDFVEINLGREYLDLAESNKSSTSTAHKAIEKIVRRRFKIAKDIDIDPAVVLGQGESNIAEQLVLAAKNKRTYNYKGWSTLLALCSGEISFVLDVFGKLYESHDPNTDYPIKTTVQNRAIKEHSKSELIALQTTRNTNANLYSVAKAFGDLSRLKLLGPKVGKKSPRFAEHTRIEIDLKSQLKETRIAIDELLNHGVFIDRGYSSAERGRTTTRLGFRKLFTPALFTTWNNRDSFSWTEETFLEFVSSPEDFVKREEAKSRTKDPGRDLLSDIQ